MTRERQVVKAVNKKRADLFLNRVKIKSKINFNYLNHCPLETVSDFV